MSDHLLTHEALTSDDRERGFADMVEIALSAAFG
jgi:purine-nucleoside phosphorylase